MTLAAWFLLIAPLAAWYATYQLARRAVVKPPIRFLSAVTGAAFLGALAGSLLAPLAIARLLGWEVPSSVSSPLLVIGVVLFSLPGPSFFVLYRFGWFQQH